MHVSKFRVSGFVFQLLVLAAISHRSFNVGEGHLSAQLVQGRETHRQVPQSDGRHQEPQEEEPRGHQTQKGFTFPRGFDSLPALHTHPLLNV